MRSEVLGRDKQFDILARPVVKMGPIVAVRNVSKGHAYQKPRPPQLCGQATRYNDARL